MKLLKNLFKRDAVAALVMRGLRDECQLARTAVVDSLQLFSGALGDNWQRISREAAAGMVLVSLAKNSSLGSCVNAFGWQLVLAFVGDHPDFVRYLSPRALADIGAYRGPGIDRLLTQAA